MAEITFNYQNKNVEENMQPILSTLSRTQSYQKLTNTVAGLGYDTIDVYSIDGSGVPGRVTIGEEGRPAIGINFTNYYFAEHSVHGIYADPSPPGSHSASRALPLVEIFYHELAHIGLGHFSRSALDRVLDAMSVSGAPGKTSITESEAIQFVNDTLRAELRLPYSRLTHVLDAKGQGYYLVDPQSRFPECFVSGTMISMWPLDPEFAPDPTNPYKQYDQDAVRPKIWKKPIEEVKVGDYVVSHDKNGNMVPGYVPRVMENKANYLLDFWGIGTTPGHATYCGDGRFKGEHVPVLDILRSDGAYVNLDGQIVRAATNFEVGSREDGFVSVVTGKARADGTVNVKQSGRIRLGTRFEDTDGETRTVLNVIERENWLLHDDGLVSRTHVDEKRPYHLHFMDRIPKPEDYILERSNLTLAQIYAAGEWEQIKPKMPAPATATAIAPPTAATASAAMPSLEPKSNIPPAFANHPDAPKKAAKPKPQRVMNRKQRKAMEAKQRRATKIRRKSA